jgi:hypothetical protein
MAMELEGRNVRRMNVQTGTSARGAWSKQDFIFEYQEGNYPSQVCMNVWGEDKVRELEKYRDGDKVKISFNLSSREYIGRWYTDVRAWRIEPAAQAAPAAQDVPPVSYDDPYSTGSGSYNAPLDEEDLPF